MKMKQKTRLLTTVLLIALLFGNFPAQVFAENKNITGKVADANLETNGFQTEQTGLSSELFETQETQYLNEETETDLGEAFSHESAAESFGEGTFSSNESSADATDQPSSDQEVKLFSSMSSDLSVGTTNITVEAVAKIGEQQYSSLDAAIQAANDGDTVVLLKNALINTSITKQNITLEISEGVTLIYAYQSDSKDAAIICNANITVAEGATIQFMAMKTYSFLAIMGNFTLESGAKAETVSNNYSGSIVFKGSFVNYGTLDASGGYVYVKYGTKNKGNIIDRTGGHFRTDYCITTPTKTSISDPYVYITEVKGTVVVGQTLHAVIDGFGEVTMDDIFALRWSSAVNGAVSQYDNKCDYIVSAKDAGGVIKVCLNPVFTNSQESGFIIVDTATQKAVNVLNTATGLYNPVVSEAVPLQDVVYLSADSGKDTNTGISADSPLKTLEAAYRLAANNATIVIMDNVIVPVDKNYRHRLSTTKNVTFTGKYNGMTYPDAKLSTAGLYMVYKEATFRDITLASTGESPFKGYFYTTAENAVINLINVQQEGTMKFSYNKMSGIQLNITDCQLSMSAQVGADNSITLDNSQLCSTFDVSSPMGNVSLKNNSCIVTTQPITNLTADGTDNEFWTLYASSYSERYPGVITVSGSVAASKAIQVGVVDDELNEVDVTAGQKLFVSNNEDSLNAEDFVLSAADYPDFNLKKNQNDICVSGVVDISGVEAAAGLIYNGSEQIGYTGTPVCMSGSTDVTAQCGDLTYIYTSTDEGDYHSFTAPTEAGSYKLVISVSEKCANYEGSREIEFSIAQKELTIEGMKAVDRVYDGSANVNLIGGFLAGIEGNDDVSAVIPDVGSMPDKLAGNDKTVSFTPISLIGSDKDNYMLKQPVLTVNIDKAPLTITELSAMEHVYDGSKEVVVTGGILNGVVDNDNVTAEMPVIGMMTDENAGANKTVSVTTPGLTGNDASNYELTSVNDIQVNILPRKLTVDGVLAENRSYDGTRAITLSGGHLNGVIDGDDVLLDVSGAEGTVESADRGDNKPVTASGYVLSGGAKANYTLSQPDSITVNITAKTVNVTVDDKVMIQGESVPAFTVNYSGFIGTDTNDNALETLAAAGTAADGKTAGTFDITLITAPVLNTTNGENYTLSVKNGQLTVKAPEYKIIEGAGQKVEIKNNAEARFRSDAPYGDYIETRVDGNKIDEDFLIVSEGSTIVILKAEYVKILSEGEHNLRIVSTYGYADTNFTVMHPADESQETGDDERASYTITTSAGNGGYFSTGATVTVKEGDHAGFTIYCNSGYRIANVYVDGKSVGAVNYYEFKDVRANHTISATFVADNSFIKTGDSSQPMLWSGLFIVSTVVLGAFGAAGYKKRRHNH